MAPCYEDCFTAGENQPSMFGHSAFDFELSSDLVASLGELFEPTSLLPDPSPFLSAASSSSQMPSSQAFFAQQQQQQQQQQQFQQQLQQNLASPLSLMSPDARFPTLAQGIAAAATVASPAPCVSPAALMPSSFLMPPSPTAFSSSSSPFSSPFLSPASSPSSALPSSPSSFSSPFASGYSSPSPALSPDFAYAASDAFSLREPRAQCDTLPGKRVSFKLLPSDAPEILSLKEFYARVAETEMLKSLILPAHPTFLKQDDAVGHFYVLKDVRARKPPQIGNDKFNCHTRRDAGDSHWQYNVPGTDFTCRVTQWVGTDDSSPAPRLATFTSYHYYRSPARRAARWSPY